MAAVLGRIAGSLGVLVTVSIILFALVHAIPVSPARVVLGVDASEEDVAAFETEHGLDRPVIVQYVDWAGGVLAGRLGRSLVDETVIANTIRLTLPVTLITLGLFLLVINGLMVLLASALVRGFHVHGLITAILASIIVWITGLAASAVLGGDEDRRRA